MATQIAQAPDTLWDVLAKTQQVIARNSAEQSVAVMGPRRRALGPVPGFMLPVYQGADAGNDVFASNKSHRSGLLGSLGDYFDRLESATGTKITARGSNTVSLRWDNVSGNAAAYQDQQYYGRGSNGVYDQTNINIDATMFKYFHYSTTIDNSLFANPNNNKVKMDYNTASTRVEWGDINVGFQGNSLVDFNRYLSGVKISDNWSKQFHTSVLFSQTKAETKTITIPGNNTSGPYFVYAGQIVEGSDQIRIDNKVMQRGTDYTLDLMTGELNFSSGIIVLSSQTIAVSFETQGYNQSQGSIYGIRADYAPTSGTKFGVTYLTEIQHAASGLQTSTQQFYGHVDPTQPYVLDQAVDATKPVVVTVSGVPLVQNIDFVIDANLTNNILLRQSVPPTNVVSITYFPLNVSAVPGNQSVLGLDSTFRIGKLGSITLESALSSLNVSGNNYDGHAYQLRADLHPTGNVHTSLTIKDVNPTFSTIQSPGFNQNERSFDINTDYNPSHAVKLNADYQQALRPSYSTNTSASTFTPTITGFDNYKQYTLGAALSFAKTGTLAISRNFMGTDYAVGGGSDNTNDSATLTYGWKSLTFNAGLTHYKSTGSEQILTSTAGATQLVSSNSSTIGDQFGINWHALKWLDLTGNTSTNDIKSDSSGTFTDTVARSSQFSARVSAIKNLRLTYSYQNSDSGNNNTESSTVTNTGTGGTGGTTVVGTSARSWLWPFGVPLFALRRDAGTTGTLPTAGLPTSSLTTAGGGVNTNLGGYGSYSGLLGNGSNTGYDFSSFGGTSATNRIQLDYTPRPAMQMGVSVEKSSSVGAYQYNSDRNAYAANFNWQPSDKFSINTTYTLEHVLYTNGQGGTDTNVFSVMFSGHPFGGKIGMSLNWQTLRTTSNVQFLSSTTGTTITGTGTPANTDSNVMSLFGRLDYALTRRYTLFAQMSRTDSAGYLANTASDIEFGLDYSLTKAFKFSVGWQIIDQMNHDVTDATYNYHVSSLLAQLGLNFN